jgi:hypothetical protein
MADVENWEKFIQGRWKWTSFGYEGGFPRGCQFTDVDAATEFDGSRLLIEPKHHEGIGPCPYPKTGQLLFLRDEAKLGKTVFVLYGCAVCNDPHAIRYIGADRSQDEFVDWRGLGKESRRQLLKWHIDRAMGLVGGTEASA